MQGRRGGSKAIDNHLMDSLSAVRHSSLSVYPQPRDWSQNIHCPRDWQIKGNTTHSQSLINTRPHQVTQHILMEQENMPSREMRYKRIMREKQNSTGVLRKVPSRAGMERSLLRGCPCLFSFLFLYFYQQLYIPTRLRASKNSFLPSPITSAPYLTSFQSAFTKAMQNTFTL